MGLLFVLIGYFFDYKKDKNNFLKDLSTGIIYLVINAIFFGILNKVFGVGLLYCIFGFSVELVIVFALKAYIQSKKD